MFGLQWDLVCKFLEVKGISQSEIKSDSTSWGNYSNSRLTLVRGKYLVPSGSSWIAYNTDTTNYVTSSKTSDNTNYNVLLSTRATAESRVMNICDFAGNVFEFTLENSNSTKKAVLRGGCFALDGQNANAASRGTMDIGGKYIDAGFRMTFYD
jgi:formylglycine-generating enzyme required for sulfatase activity